MQYCSQEGGYLAEIKSKEEQVCGIPKWFEKKVFVELNLLKLQEALGFFVPNSDNNWYWLGLNDIETEGTFVWDHSGTEAEASFNNWSERQPDNGRDIEDCALLVGVP